MARPAPDRDVAPTVQRLRLRYAKRGRLRFSSHRDFQRALERALRRADIPMAYSAGFSPHPKVSYANSAPTGVASEAEYVEIGVAQACNPEAVRAALDAALPPGLDVVEVVEARTSDFANRLEASIWRVELPGVSRDEAERAVGLLLAETEVLVDRMTKNGRRTFDARSAVIVAECAADAGPADDCAILTLVVRHGTPSVRPDDVLSALSRVADLVPPKPPRVTRLAQGPLDEAGTSVVDPFAPDRAG
ncbi:MAG: TIGR03936 family radical SAM-associated protein [Actinobacteria bacterium]|nr:TIGR03936 family radical SAM-associated protein [Actinomycetota bacterium]